MYGDPHLDQRAAPLTLITMNWVVSEPEALGGPTVTYAWVCSNPSNIKYQQPKHFVVAGRNLRTYFSHGCISRFRVCRWRHVQQKEKYVHCTVPSYPPMENQQNWYILCTLFFLRRTMPRNMTKSSKSRGKKTDISYKPGISFNALNGEIISDLYSDEYEFDANEYQKWHLDYRFNLDACASIANHKCENYASKDESFLDLSAKDLFNKSIWMFPPIELAKDFILHYETIRLQQPDSMTDVICLPKLNTPGSDYKHLVKNYKCIHTYPAGSYLFSRFVNDSPFEKISIPTNCPYDLFLADEFISERENQSLHAKEINAIHTSQIYKEAMKSTLVSKDKEEDESTSESDEKLIQFKTHQPHFMTPYAMAPPQVRVIIY